MNISFWNKIFLFLSGTNLKTIRQCPAHEVTNYSILGSLVCIPGILGFCSSYYAFSLVFPTGPVIVLATLWMLLIMTFDRAIVAHNPYIYTDNDEDLYQVNKQTHLRQARLRGVWIGVFRVVISIALGFVITEPLCAGIFHSEIKKQLNADLNIELDSARRPFELERATLLKQKKDADSAAYKARKLTTSEIAGTAESQKQGRGDIAKRKEKDEAFYLKERDSTAKEIAVRVDTLDHRQSRKEKNIRDNDSDGILSSIKALHKVARHEPGILIALWVLRALLLGIELMPLALKGKYKTRTDEYVRICHENGQIAILFNAKEENSLTKKELEMLVATENIVLESILKEKNIEKAATDFKFYFNINEDAAVKYEKGKSKIESILRDDLIRKHTANALFESYKAFITKIKEEHNKTNGV